MAWRRNLQVSSVGTSAERLGVGADHDGGRAAGAKGAATEETRKGLRLRILPGTGCHQAGPPSKSGARAGGGRSDDFTQSNCGGTEAELATSATTCLHPQPPSRAYICVRNHQKQLRVRGAIEYMGVLRWLFGFRSVSHLWMKKAAVTTVATATKSTVARAPWAMVLGEQVISAQAASPARGP